MANNVERIPRVGIDFWYITSGTVERRDELEYPMDDEGDRKLAEARRRGDLVKCLIIRCHETRCVFAHVVPAKGVDEDKAVAKLVVEDTTWLAHARLITKADNEASIKKLVSEALKGFCVHAEEANLEQAGEEHPETMARRATGAPRWA